MVPLFGAILCSSESEAQIDLLLARMKLEGLSAFYATAKSWKDEKDGIRIFSKVSPALAKELLEWSIEPLLYGKFSDTEKEAFIRTGVTLSWEREISDFFQMPFYMMKPGPIEWSICTGNQKLDKHLALILKSFGQSVSVEGEMSHLISRLRTSSVNLALIDWDQKNFELQKNILQLKKIRQEKETLFIGIKNFDKDNLYRDLTYGISEVSPSLFPLSEIIEIVVRSLPILPDLSEVKGRKYPIRKLAFDFQEKIKPTRYKLIEEFIEEKTDSPINTQTRSLVSLYEWLFNRSFE